jgi:hypothetical protein
MVNLKFIFFFQYFFLVFNLANQKQKKQNQIQKDKENFISFKIFSQSNFFKIFYINK